MGDVHARNATGVQSADPSRSEPAEEREWCAACGTALWLEEEDEICACCEFLLNDAAQPFSEEELEAVRRPIIF